MERKVCAADGGGRGRGERAEREGSGREDGGGGRCGREGETAGAAHR